MHWQSRASIQAMNTCGPHCSHHPILLGMWVLTLEQREYRGSVPWVRMINSRFFLFSPSLEAYPAVLAWISSSVIRKLQEKKLKQLQSNSYAKKNNNQSAHCNIQHILHSKRTIKLPATLYSAFLLPAIISIISIGTLYLITYFCGIWAWNVCVP